MIKTKQELLNHFSDINEMYNNPFKYQTLSNMIDELLEQQPCEDCISRTEALSRIDAERKHLLDLNMDGAEHIIVHHARRIIEDMPSVTPTRPHGEWNYVQYDGNKNIGNWHCSNCRQICIAMHSMDDAFDFCPNCGADMREVQDEDSN